MQTTSHLLMIRPVSFGYNAETAVNNAFQIAGTQQNVQAAALQEFDNFVTLLRNYNADVTVVEDSPTPHTPDSIFPNNWVSFHHDGTLVLYPMFAANRRAERKAHVLQTIRQKFSVLHQTDLSTYEKQGIFLEGTGSMVLDRENKIAYACLSPRTDLPVLNAFCKELQYEAVSFTAADSNGHIIYHTNVMMCVADKFAVICLESISDKTERKKVEQRILNSGKKIIAITLNQVNQFAGNMLQIENKDGEKLLVMSTQAYSTLTVEQTQELIRYNRIVHAPLNTIESNGGGSARCMIAEVHLPLL
jgi:hypothetical protein